MTSTRREFIASSLATVAAGSLVPRVLYGAESTTKASKPLRILILGGTGFLGPACTEAALARGHTVTHFNSGRTEVRRQEAGRPSVGPGGHGPLAGTPAPNQTAASREKEGKTCDPRDPRRPQV